LEAAEYEGGKRKKKKKRKKKRKATQTFANLFGLPRLHIIKNDSATTQVRGKKKRSKKKKKKRGVGRGCRQGLLVVWGVV